MVCYENNKVQKGDMKFKKKQKIQKKGTENTEKRKTGFPKE